MDVKNSEVYRTILQNQDHCLKTELKSVFYLRLRAQTMRVQFIKKPETKVSSNHILLFSCSVTRAVHIELVSSLTTTEFIKSFKRLISRRGKPKIVYSDNAKTFKARTKWLANINRDQKLHDFLSSETILWNFNVPKAPWWSGQFKRLIGLIKASSYRTIGKHSWHGQS